MARAVFEEEVIGNPWDNGMVRIKCTCVTCERDYTVVIDSDKWHLWYVRGYAVQDVFLPSAYDASYREHLICIRAGTPMCTPCWENMSFDLDQWRTYLDDE